MIEEIKFPSQNLARAVAFVFNAALQDNDEKLPFGWTRKTLKQTVDCYADKEGNLTREKLDELAKYLEEKTKEFGHNVPKDFFNVQDADFDIKKNEGKFEWKSVAGDAGNGGRAGELVDTSYKVLSVNISFIF